MNPRFCPSIIVLYIVASVAALFGRYERKCILSSLQNEGMLEDCDHCYGFYSHLGQSLHDSEQSYELFADLAEEDGSAMEVRDGVLGVKDTAIGDVFENRGKKMQFLFDYGDDHRFELEARGFDETMPGVVYPRLMSAKGELGPQYPDYNDVSVHLPQNPHYCIEIACFFGF